MAAVELQLRGCPLFLLLHGQMNGVQNQIHSLICSGFAGHNATVIEVPDHGQVQYALLGVDIRDLRSSFAVGLVCVKLSYDMFLHQAGCLSLPVFAGSVYIAAAFSVAA